MCIQNEHTIPVYVLRNRLYKLQGICAQHENSLQRIFELVAFLASNLVITIIIMMAVKIIIIIIRNSIRL